MTTIASKPALHTDLDAKPANAARARLRRRAERGTALTQALLVLLGVSLAGTAAYDLFSTTQQQKTQLAAHQDVQVASGATVADGRQSAGGNADVGQKGDNSSMIAGFTAGVRSAADVGMMVAGGAAAGAGIGAAIGSRIGRKSAEQAATAGRQGATAAKDGEGFLAGAAKKDEKEKPCEGAACAKADGSPGCFVAGTPVLTPNGFVPIEQIKVGDYVIATDPSTLEGGMAVAENDEAEEGEEGEEGEYAEGDDDQMGDSVPNTGFIRLVAARLDGGYERVVVPAERSFQVGSKGWLAAADLQPGMVVTDGGKGSLQVIDVGVSAIASNQGDLVSMPDSFSGSFASP